MEDNTFTPEMETPHSSSIPIPQITLESLGYLNTAAKWTKFLAILGFIVIGLMFLAGVVMGIAFSFLHTTGAFSNFPFPTYFLGFIYLILAAIYVLPVIYLNNFSNYISKAVAIRETEMLTTALRNLKSLAKYVGIMTIVLIASYFVFIIFIVGFAMHHGFQPA